MDQNELLKKVRKIEIKSKGLSNQIFSGEYHSAFKGRGMTFSEVREYQFGDEIRTIDWNVTARFNHPFVKVFEEEREISVILLIDVSASENFGTTSQQKKDLITEVAATIAFSAIQNNDKIGVVLFSDQVEKFIPPKKGKTHILRIIREILEHEPKHKGTDVASVLKFITSAIKRRSTVFLVSDFISKDFTDALKVASRKHDVVALCVNDEREETWPDIGLVPIKDAESGEVFWMDTSSKTVRAEYEKNRKAGRLKLKEVFRSSGVDHADLTTGHNYVRPLISLFKRRGLR